MMLPQRNTVVTVTYTVYCSSVTMGKHLEMTGVFSIFPLPAFQIRLFFFCLFFCFLTRHILQKGTITLKYLQKLNYLVFSCNQENPAKYVSPSNPAW